MYLPVESGGEITPRGCLIILLACLVGVFSLLAYALHLGQQAQAKANPMNHPSVARNGPALRFIFRQADKQSDISGQLDVLARATCKIYAVDGYQHNTELTARLAALEADFTARRFGFPDVTPTNYNSLQSATMKFCKPKTESIRSNGSKRKATWLSASFVFTFLLINSLASGNFITCVSKTFGRLPCFELAPYEEGVVGMVSDPQG